MTSDTVTLIAILGMACATLATRTAGFWLMGYVTFSPRVERFLRQTASGVLIAIVVASCYRGDPALWLALLAAGTVMRLTGRQMLSILGGTALAIGLRFLGSF